ncbi:MAG: hypothetical protein JRN52_03695 [Nitrososphaerota archaeon]|nr:hypothetical protein [Nitrososphaerota archaeon]
MRRTNISIDHAVFNEFSSQAEKKSKTLFTYANEWLSMASKIAAEGGEPSDVQRLWRSISLLKQVDVITLPSDFVDELIAKQYAADKDGLLALFRELGSEISGVLKIAAENLQELQKLATDFIALLPLKQFKVSAADDPEGRIEIDVVGAGKRIESTECALEFLSAILNGYGYNATKHEINVGTIRLWALKRNS